MSSKFAAVFAVLLAALFGIQHVRAQGNSEDATRVLFKDLDDLIPDRGENSALMAFNGLIGISLRTRAVTAYGVISGYLDSMSQTDNPPLKKKIRDAFVKYLNTCGPTVDLQSYANKWIKIGEEADAAQLESADGEE